MKRLLAVVVVPLLVACAGAGEADTTTPPPAAPSSTAAPSTTTPLTTAAPTTVAPTSEPPVDPLQVLITNDDGIGAGGIDTLVTALSALDWVQLTVVAPAENQSGSSDTTTDGPVVSAPAATASGFEGTAVQGFPADSVNVALDELGLDPDLVVSGINAGQNIGPFVELSGTVGAARTAARRGIPAVAASAGLVTDGEPDYATVATLVVAWFEEFRGELLDGSFEVSVTNINAPSCAPGTELRGVVEVPVAPELADGVDPFVTDCASTLTDPVDDVQAIVNGFGSISDPGF